MGIVIGTDVQAFDAELAAIAGLTSAADKIIRFTGSGTAGLLDFKDEDDLASDSATALPSQQSVKAYVDSRAITNLTDALTENSSVYLGNSPSSTDTAENNVGVGATALNNITTGDQNTAVGSAAGNSITTGVQNTLIGQNAATSANNGSNQTAIGFGATCSANNEITLGNSNVTTLRCADTSIASLSDARDKTDVKDLPWGLDFIDTLRPVQFTWDRRILTEADVNHPKNGVKRAGFLAQDFQNAMPNGENDILDLVHEVNEDRIEAKYGNLIPMLTQAIKDLKAQNESLVARVNALENSN